MRMRVDLITTGFAFVCSICILLLTFSLLVSMRRNDTYSFLLAVRACNNITSGRPIECPLGYGIRVVLISRSGGMRSEAYGVFRRCTSYAYTVLPNGTLVRVEVSSP